jgi:hypothetical protein
MIESTCVSIVIYAANTRTCAIWLAGFDYFGAIVYSKNVAKENKAFVSFGAIIYYV